MSHDHHRDHAGHSHAPQGFGAAFAAATALNLGLVAAQIVFGLRANSLALFADAGHNFGDTLGLVLAWTTHVLARKQPTARFTYGYRSASILSALANAAMLFIATGAIGWEAIRRFISPGDVDGTIVIAVAAAGIVANGASAGLLMGGRKGDLNIRGAFLHLAADAAVSGAVVVAGGLLLLTGWAWIDPAISLMVSAVIVWGSWGLLRESLRLSMDAVPSAIEPANVHDHLRALPGVAGLHDLHIWAMSTTETALTCHLVMPAGHPGDQYLAELSRELDHRFHISHATLQIELGDAAECALEPPHVV
jgi:cobalt-zinc-cadmium efflux system protein